MADIAPKLLHLNGDELLSLHERIHKSEASPATIEVHHTIVNELARRKMERPRDNWDKFELLVDSNENVDLASLAKSFPSEMMKELVSEIGSDVADINTYFTADGYEMRIEPVKEESQMTKHLPGGHDQQRHAPGYAQKIADEINAGTHPTVLPADVGALFGGFAKLKDHPDITELKVEGTFLFGDEGLGISRKDMPQIPGKARPEFLADLEAEGTKVAKERVDPKTLKPIQKEISGSRAGAIYEKFRESGEVPKNERILVSKDGFVIDGHHTWAASVALSFDNGSEIPIYRIGLNAKEALSRSLEWSKSKGYESQALDAPAKKSFFEEFDDWDSLVLKHGTGDQKPHGSWANGTEGDSNSGRSSEALAKAKEVFAKAASVEPRITALMKDLAKQTGGELVGLENALKSEKSLARKIDTDAVKNWGGDRELAGGMISDSVRYTMNFGDDNYTANLDSTINRMQSSGWKVSDVKNFWQAGDPYDGVNIKAERFGVKVELQLHTPASYKIKVEGLNENYQAYREAIPIRERWSLYSRMVRYSDKTARPSNVASLMAIGTLVFQGFQTAQQSGLIKSTGVGIL